MRRLSVTYFAAKNNLLQLLSFSCKKRPSGADSPPHLQTSSTCLPTWPPHPHCPGPTRPWGFSPSPGREWAVRARMVETRQQSVQAEPALLRAGKSGAQSSSSASHERDRRKHPSMGGSLSHPLRGLKTTKPSCTFVTCPSCRHHKPLQLTGLIHHKTLCASGPAPCHRLCSFLKAP